MTKTSPITAGRAVNAHNTPVTSGRFPPVKEQPQRSQPLMRRYEIVHLLPNGDIDDFSRIAPAHPSFEDSFGAIARGSLLKTDRGTTAIEDILPGDQVMTITHGLQTVKWRGAMTIVPNQPEHAAAAGKLIRITAEALGFGRPMSDLLLGPAARLYHHSPTLQRLTGHTAVFVPAKDFVDGVNVFEIQPPTSVQAFQIGFDAHERIAVNGVEIDSHNPGARHQLGLRGDMLDLYLSLFPHVERIEDFGMLMHPRMSLRDLDFNVVA